MYQEFKYFNDYDDNFNNIFLNVDMKNVELNLIFVYWKIRLKFIVFLEKKITFKRLYIHKISMKNI